MSKRTLVYVLLMGLMMSAYGKTADDWLPVTQLEDGTEYAIRNANATLTKRNLYWGSWNRCLQTQSSGNLDDLTFLAHRIEDGTWTFRVTSPENWGWYLARYGDNNVSCLREVAYWTVTYVESTGTDGSGFVLLPKGDAAGQGHEMMMNAGGDWVVSFQGSSSDKYPNSSHWEFFPITHVETISDYPIRNVDFSRVQLSDRFWRPRMEQNQRVTIPVALQQCYDTRRVLNFQKAAAILRGENIGYFDTEFTFDDTDIYKILEGMAYSVQVMPNAALDAKMDELIELIGSAQEPDGYLYTPRTAGNPAGLHFQVGQNRWEADPVQSHELYCSGHLFEAAVAHYISTGKTSLLDIAKKNADLLVREFLVGGLTYEPGHQIVEMGLVKMYRVTGNEDYLRLAKYFLDLRGTLGSARNENTQTHKPVLLQDEAVGHAVRAAYMYSGMADVAALMSNADYLHAVDAIWDNMVSKKYYLTGGIGARHSGEEFGANYELPNASAYCETCAAIGNVYWNWRMFLLHGDSKYYDVLERTLYNGVISGISLSGDHFFYPNPLESSGGYTRSEWFGCACCPSNLCRFLASVPGYMYAHQDNKVYVNLYAQGKADIDLGADYGTLRLTQTTDYPWDGNIQLTIDNEQLTNSHLALMLRLPGWAKGQPVPSDLYSYAEAQAADVTLYVNGVATPYTLTNGYMVIDREWSDGDVVSFTLPMEVHQVLAHENVEDDRDKVAIERGPLVYCLEAVDNDGQVFSSVVTEEATAQPVADDTRFGTDYPLTVLSLSAQNKGFDSEGNITTADHLFTAIPYYAWANRGGDAMAVWLPRTADKAVANIDSRAIDGVDAGETQSEQAHRGTYSNGSNTGTYANETWRDTQGSGFVQYVLYNPEGVTENVSLSIRMTTNDVGRTALVTLDGESLAHITIPKRTRHADGNGMYEAEIAVPSALLKNADGTPKASITFRMTSTNTSLSIPGIFYLRLLSPALIDDYQFVASEWRSCDETRVRQQDIAYDTEANTLTVHAGTGSNNVALQLDTDLADYTCLGKPWLVVRGTNLSTASSAHVLWWLNGVNRNSSIPANHVVTADNGDIVVAWDLTQCDLNDHCLGDWWNITTGLTCFGLTSTTGTTDIHYIGFVPSVEEYLTPTSIDLNTQPSTLNFQAVYDLQGRRLATLPLSGGVGGGLPQGIYISGNRKWWVK